MHLTALVYAVPTWSVLDEWVGMEHSRGGALAREAMTKAAARPPSTEEEQFELLKPFLDWGMALSQNLRFLRKTGHNAEALARLRDIAKEHVEAIYQRHGWPLPETALQPLDVHPHSDTSEPENG